MTSIAVTSVGDVNEETLEKIQQHLRGALHCETRRILKSPRPEFAFDHKRMQYNSSLIMRDLLHHPCGETTKLLALTEVDLFIPMLSFVFGQAQLNGNIAIVSQARLHQEFYALPPNRDLLFIRTIKEVMHEIGHAYGLIHCINQDCPMSLSTTIQQLDKKGSLYCQNCTALLKESKQSPSLDV